MVISNGSIVDTHRIPIDIYAPNHYIRSGYLVAGEYMNTHRKQYVVVDEMAVRWSAGLIRRLIAKDPVNPAEITDCLRALDQHDPLGVVLREAGCGSP